MFADFLERLQRDLLRVRPIRQWWYRPIMVLPNRAREAVRKNAAAAPVAVADLMARHDAAGHVAQADAYFGRHDDPLLFRRPFQSGEDAQIRLAALANVVQHLELFEGARVLDFGCGTGWVSRCLAYMGAEMVGVDVSATVLDLARSYLSRDPLFQELRVEFRRFDSHVLPVDDASMDRIVSFDAFHHVLDQDATLAEMSRVLKPGGIAVFHEPGPEHSLTNDAQSEMKNYGVIENNIDVKHIWQSAKAHGFNSLRLSLPALQAPICELEQFERVASGRPSRTDVRMVMQNIVNFSYNLRIFALRKNG